jgi:predicted DNA-binding WGR domain protein
MLTNTNVIDKAKLLGGLSSDLTESDFFKAYTAGERVGGYIGSEQRNPDRDKIIEAYLKSKGCLPNSSAFLLGSKKGAKMMEKVSQDTPLRDFLGKVQETFDAPIPTIYEVLNAANIHQLSKLGKELKKENVTDAEEGVKVYLRIKNGKITEVKNNTTKNKPARNRYDFEGRYECTKGNHNKFWEVHQNADGTFTASWGRIERGVQDSKNDYTLEEVRKVVAAKTGSKGYRKVS